MKRKFLSILLAFVMMLTLLPTSLMAAEPTYGDTAGHWAESSIERWSAYGIIQGSNGQFDPDGQLTCAQLATILAKLLKLPAAKDAGFTDNTADAWYYDAINRCAAAGILNGNGDGTVTPEAPITRERAMVMLARALGIEPISNPDLTKYADAAQVSAYAQGYVAALIEAGIVGGVTADQLAPQANINRASTVTILDRAISTYADKAGETVKTDGKGLVLVVAENVKITGAPEGTKIVVADGATGLTVNGKSVSDDQTYIVPKTTTSSGSSSGGYSHIHAYDENNYCEGCGQFKDTVLATIDKKGYETLEAAINAAQSGDTVKLMKNIAISPELSDEQKQESKLVAQLTVNTDIVLDMNGKKLSVTEGDFGNASPLLIAVTGGTVTVKGNGEINCEAGESQVYGINVNGGKLIIEDGTFYGAITAVQVQQGSLIIKGGTFDLAPTCKSMVPQYAKYIVNVIDSAWKNGTATVSISGGTFGFDPSANPEGTGTTYLADGYQATETAEGSGFWTITAASDAVFVAEVGGVQYTTLAAAIAAAQDGATVTLVGDVALDADVSISNKITLDLNGRTIETNGNMIGIAATGDLTVTGNGKLNNGVLATGSKANKDADYKTMLRVAEGGKLTIENGTFATKASQAVLTGGITTIKSGTFQSTATVDDFENASVIYSTAMINVAGTSASLTMTDGTINAGGYEEQKDGLYGIYVQDGGNVVLGDEEAKTGPTIDAYCAAIGENNTTSPANITIYGGTYTTHVAPDNDTHKEQFGYFCAVIYASASGNITISGGTFNGYYGISSRYVKVAQNLNISGGTFNGTEAALFVDDVEGSAKNGERAISITGGTFSSDPGDYVADGLVAILNKDTNKYEIVRGGKTLEKAFPNADVDFGYGRTSTEAINLDGENEVIITEWVDAWVNANTTIKGVTFMNGAVFSTKVDDITVTLEDCTFYACDLEKITVTHKVNSGAGMCLNLEKASHNGVKFIVKNCTFIGENDNTLDRDGIQYNADGTPTGQKKSRGHAIALDAICGGGTGTLDALTIEGCIINGVRGNAIQLYGKTGNISIKDTYINSWGMNNNTAKDDAAIRGDYNSDSRTISLENVYFGLNENTDSSVGKVLFHVNVDSFSGNTDGTQVAGTYSYSEN